MKHKTNQTQRVFDFLFPAPLPPKMYWDNYLWLESFRSWYLAPFENKVLAEEIFEELLIMVAETEFVNKTLLRRRMAQGYIRRSQKEKRIYEEKSREEKSR